MRIIQNRTGLFALGSLSAPVMALVWGLALGLTLSLVSWTTAASGEGFFQETEQPSGSEAPAEPEVAPEQGAEEKTALEKTVRVVRGTIDGEINNVASAYVTRLVADVKAKKAEVLLLEMNTFGGRVDSAVAIRDALIDLDATTIVFINKRAISAGALISLACDKIAMSPGGTIGAATPVLSGPGAEMPQAVEEKYLSYFREEMRSTAETSGRDPDIAEAMVDSDKEVEGVSESGKLLTLTTQKAMELKFVDLEATSVEETLEKLGYPTESEELARSWSENLAAFLTNSSVASFLFLAMLVCAYMEYQTPGFGLFGGLAIFCFAVLYLSHYLVNLAGWEELILFVLGVVLLLVEIFVIPGFGISGILGIFCLLASGTLMLMAGDWSDFSLSNPFSLDAVQRVLFSTLLGFGVLLLLLRLLPKTGSGPSRRLVLATTLGGDAGYLSHESSESSDDLVGEEGEAITPLRPSGRARIGGRRLEVETEGEFIERGEAVKVVRQAAGRIIVRLA